MEEQIKINIPKKYLRNYIIIYFIGIFYFNYLKNGYNRSWIYRIGVQTTEKNIWVLRNVNGGPKFTYISLDPSFAIVGLNIKQAKEKGYKVLVAKMVAENIPRSKQIVKTEGFIKIIIDKDTEEILGAIIICDESSEMIHLLQLAIDMKLKYTYLRDRIYAHPTMTEGLNDVLSSAMIKNY